MMQLDSTEMRLKTTRDGQHTIEQHVHRGNVDGYFVKVRVLLNQGLVLTLDSANYYHAREEDAWAVADLLAGIVEMQLEAVNLPPRASGGYVISKYDGDLPQWTGVDKQGLVHAMSDVDTTYCETHRIVMPAEDGSLTSRMADVTCPACTSHFGLKIWKRG